MATEFDYNAPDVPATAVADVVAAISSYGKLPPLSDAEIEQRRINNEIWRWQCQQREEQRRFEYEQRERSDLLDFRAVGDEKWQIVHGWLRDRLED